MIDRIGDDGIEGQVIGAIRDAVGYGVGPHVTKGLQAAVYSTVLEPE